MAIQHLHDAIFDFTKEIAQKVYDNHDDIYEKAESAITERGGYADDPDAIDMEISDIIDEMIYKKLHGVKK